MLHPPGHDPDTCLPEVATVWIRRWFVAGGKGQDYPGGDSGVDRRGLRRSARPTNAARGNPIAEVLPREVDADAGAVGAALDAAEAIEGHLGRGERANRVRRRSGGGPGELRLTMHTAP